MKKTDSLRAWLTAAVPALKAAPDRFLVFTDKGSLRATGAPSAAGVVAFEWRYTATLLMLDFAGDPDAVAVALFAWLAANQPELLQNFDRNRQGVAFEADILDGQKVDLQIAVELTERVGAVPAEGGGVEIQHWAEPAQAGAETWPGLEDAPPPATSIYAGGELIAEIPGG